MKKFNKNIVLFAFAMVFIVSGAASPSYARSQADEIKNTAQSAVHGDLKTAARSIRKTNEIIGENLNYHDLMMDINSYKENITGARIMKKDDSTVVKFDSGSLCRIAGKPLTLPQAEELAEKVEELRDCAQSVGADFLYCGTPIKNYYEKLPVNVEDQLRFHSLNVIFSPMFVLLFCVADTRWRPRLY